MHKSWRGHELSPKSATMPREKTFSFAEIVQGRDAGVRVTDDNMLYAVDLVMVMTGKDRNNAGRDLRDLSDEIFQSTKFVDWQEISQDLSCVAYPMKCFNRSK
jgi:hypothetical protein